MPNFDQLKLAVEGMSGGSNTIILDDLGMPSYMVRIPQIKYSDVLDGADDTIHDAFIVDGVAQDVLYISKYQNVVVNSRAYSLPGKDLATSLNFDTALTVCRNKGAGWHLTTNALWAAIALWCKKNGTQPHGNNNYGQDYTAAHEKGVPTHMADATRVGRTATGSGPPSWYHNNDTSGIADLNGNVQEWVSGLRLVNGEIQIIPYGNAMKTDSNMSSTSTEWKAVLQDGTLVNPGTANTLKWDYTTTPPSTGATTAINLIAGNLANQQPDNSPYGRQKYGNLVAASGVTPPLLLKALGLFPDALLADYNGVGDFYMRNIDERLPHRGGAFNYGAGSAIFALLLRNARTDANTLIGFRSAYYSP